MNLRLVGDKTQPMKKILALLIVSVLFSFNFENDFISRLSIRIEQFAKLNPQENLCLFTNQEKFSTNDTIFFSAYYYQSDLRPIISKRVFSVALFSSSGRVINKINFSIVNGHAYNQIPIPPDCIADVLTIEAFDPNSGEKFFSKPITVVARKKIEANLTEYPTQFAFEGGNFVLNANNRLVVKTAPDETISLSVLRRVIATTHSDSFGIASFDVIPKKGEAYSVEVKGSSISLPTPVEQACALRLTDAGEQKRIEIDFSDNVRDEKGIFLLLVNNQKIIASSAVAPAKTGTFIYTIDTRELPNGITEAVIITETSVLAKRSFFYFQPKAIVNLQLDSFSTQRNQVLANILIKDNAGNPMQGNFTVSVSPLSASENLLALRIEENYYLNSTLARFPAPYPNDNISRSKLINEILIFSPPKGLPWNELLKNNIMQKSTSNKLILKARLNIERASVKVADSTLLNCFLQNSMIGYEASLKNDLTLEIPFLYDFYGREEIFYSLDDKLTQLTGSYRLIVDTLAVTPIRSWRAKEIGTTDEYGETEFKVCLVEESYGFFQNKNEKQATVANLNERFEDEANGVDLSVNVDDYVVFPTMQDLVKEVIPFLEVRKRKETLHTRLLIKQKTHFKRPKFGPLFVIDGALTKDETLFLNLKPVEVFRIKIINDANRLTQFGSLGQNGIVLVETKKKSTDKVKDNSKTISFLGLSRPVDQKQHKLSSNRIPDLRTNLCWSPLTETNAFGQASVSITTSDLKGSFVVTVRGKTRNGNPFETTQRFEVK